MGPEMGPREQFSMQDFAASRLKALSSPSSKLEHGSMEAASSSSGSPALGTAGFRTWDHRDGTRSYWHVTVCPGGLGWAKFV